MSSNLTRIPGAAALCNTAARGRPTHPWWVEAPQGRPRASKRGWDSNFCVGRSKNFSTYWPFPTLSSPQKSSLYYFLKILIIWCFLQNSVHPICKTIHDLWSQELQDFPCSKSIYTDHMCRPPCPLIKIQEWCLQRGSGHWKTSCWSGSLLGSVP